MKRNYYAEAINIITSETIEYKKVLMEIAKEHPAIFVKACKRACYDINSDHYDYIALLKENRKIEAIKLHRERTGLGLRESKYFIDNLQIKYDIKN